MKANYIEIKKKHSPGKYAVSPSSNDKRAV